MANSLPLRDLEDAEHAYLRVKAELDALPVAELTPLNVDVVSAASVALGAAEQILTFRERIAKLAEFELRHLDNLLDYGKTAWYAYVTNLPVPEAGDGDALVAEVAALRAKMLRWAGPLADEGLFNAAALAKIKEGPGTGKDAPSDVVALVGLFRSRWNDVKDKCSVTEQELARGAEVGPALFALISRRDFQVSGSKTDGSLRVRRAWTLLDTAYTQCRRALQYLRFTEGDADLIAPSLRRNSGPGTKPSEPAVETPPAAVANVHPPTAPAPEPAPVNAGPTIGSGEPWSTQN